MGPQVLSKSQSLEIRLLFSVTPSGIVRLIIVLLIIPSGDIKGVSFVSPGTFAYFFIWTGRKYFLSIFTNRQFYLGPDPLRNIENDMQGSINFDQFIRAVAIIGHGTIGEFDVDGPDVREPFHLVMSKIDVFIDGQKIICQI